jgi:hypothetical protein
VHEDFALLLRIQFLNGLAGTPQSVVTKTPNPTPDGVFFTDPEVLPEADPANPTGIVVQSQIDALEANVLRNTPDGVK